jgi:redox-sensitive bicupin YhaK (pirin superfamily)
LPINQQAYILMIDLDKDFEIEYQLKNSAYFFLIDGAVSIADEDLEKRDAIGLLETTKVSIKASKQSKLLVIDVPMN